jgi:primary-amine oxidase
LTQYLDLEHSYQLSRDTPQPARLARVHYDVTGGSKVPIYYESIVEIETNQLLSCEIVGSEVHASLTVSVILSSHKACL